MREFLPDLLTVPGLEIIAVQGTPRSLEKTKALCAQYGIPHALRDFAEVLALRPDAVYIATPNHLHFPYAQQALQAGLHAIVEKPLASNVTEARELFALAANRGVTLWEAITTPYLGNYQKLREWLPRIGEVRLVQCNFSQYSRKYDAFLAGATPPAFDPAQSGGVLMDLGIYNVHFTLGLLGKPQRIHYAAVTERGIDTAGVLTLQYPGALACLTAAKTCTAPACFLVEGTLGTLSCALPPNGVGAVTMTLRDGTVKRYDDGQSAHRAVPEFTAILRAIEQNETGLYAAHAARTLTANSILTEARRQAGVRFPADET